MPVGKHSPARKIADVARDADHAMAVVSGEIGIDQPSRDQLGLGRLAPGCRADGGDSGLELIRRETMRSHAHASASLPEVPPRTMRLSATAARMTAPVAPPSQYCFTPIRINPLVIIEMMRTPTKLPKIVPLPPNSPTPPTMIAAITCSSRLTPALSGAR